MCLQGKIRIAFCCVRFPEGIYYIFIDFIAYFEIQYALFSMLKKKYNSPCFGLRVMALLLRKCFLVWYCWCEWHRKMRLAIIRFCQSSCENITPRFANTIDVQNVSFQVCCEFLLGGELLSPPKQIGGKTKRSQVLTFAVSF